MSRKKVVDDDPEAAFQLGLVAVPRPATTYDWAAGTLELLDELTPLERAFAEWVAAGCTATEAYRRAKGNPDIEAARQGGYQLRHRPTVAAAIAACLKDRGVAARCDREWKIAKLQASIEKCERSSEPKAQAVLGKLVKTMAELQGEVGGKTGSAETDGPPKRTDVSARIDAILAGVAALIADREGGRAPALGWSNTGPAGGRGPEPVDAE